MTYKIKSKKVKEKKESYKVSPEKEVYIDKHNWSFEKKGNKMKVSLGNMSDAGWYWNGDEKDLIGFSYRLHHSKVSDEFYKTMGEENVTFEKLKPLYLKSAETKDGLYQISGDNVFWHFGEGDDADEIYLEDENLNEEQKNKFYDVYSPIKYEEFEKSYGNEYKQDVKKAINSSSSFKEFNEKLEGLSEDYREKVREENQERTFKALNKIKKIK